MNRRELIAALAISATPAIAGVAVGATTPRVFDPRDFGAAGDGRTLDTSAINAAIEACSQSGGGIVRLRRGSYHSGTIFLKSGVTLDLELGATLLASDDISHYPPQPGPSPTAHPNQRHLIFARRANRIAITGRGRIDGRGARYWVRSERPAARKKPAWIDAAHNDWTYRDRPSPLIELVTCTHVRIEDITIVNSPGWTIRPFDCDDVTIAKIQIKNPAFAPNVDGLDITNSSNVRVTSCIIDTGDDAICIKSERSYNLPIRVCRNIIIRNCVVSNAIKVGTKTQGGVENLHVSDCLIENPDVPLPLRAICGLALEVVDGGWLDGVVVRNIRINRIRSPLFIRRGNRSGRPDAPSSRLRNIDISGIHATGSILTSSLTGIPGYPIENIALRDIAIETTMPGKPEWVRDPVPEYQQKYPEARMFGWLPVSGLYCRHARGVDIRNLSIIASKDEFRPALRFEEVAGLKIEDLRTPGQPHTILDRVTDATILQCRVGGVRSTIEVRHGVTGLRTDGCRVIRAV